jgi:hypothetical protein
MDFWEGLFETPAGGMGRRRITPASRPACLQWLGRRTNRDGDELADTVGPQITALFTELADEYGKVSAEGIDPRFIQHFLLTPNQTGDGTP